MVFTVVGNLNREAQLSTLLIPEANNGSRKVDTSSTKIYELPVTYDYIDFYKNDKKTQHNKNISALSLSVSTNYKLVKSALFHVV